MEKLIKWIKDKNISTPVKLELVMPKVLYNGRRIRYFMKAYIDGHDVTQMLADALQQKVSHAQNTDGCMMVYDRGMDMAFWVQDQAYMLAYPIDSSVFDREFYVLLG